VLVVVSPLDCTRKKTKIELIVNRNQRSFSVTELNFKTMREVRENIELLNKVRHQSGKNLTL
jgi:hypothetical protein